MANLKKNAQQPKKEEERKKRNVEFNFIKKKCRNVGGDSFDRFFRQQNK